MASRARRLVDGLRVAVDLFGWFSQYVALGFTDECMEESREKPCRE